MVRLYLSWLLVLMTSCIYAQGLRKSTAQVQLREKVIIKTDIFTVTYSETKEQPISLTYKSSNRVKNVDRGSMDFHTEDEYHTSDKHDYYANVWDKGHLAPAATYSPSVWLPRSVPPVAVSILSPSATPKATVKSPVTALTPK